MTTLGSRTSPNRLQALPYILLVFIAAAPLPAHASSNAQGSDNPAKALTLEELGNVEVTSVSREPEEVWKTSAAIYVITQEDIQRSGATSIPDALRLAPGVEVARVDSNKWSIGIRGFGSRLSRDVLVLIDGRTVYTTLLAGTYWEEQNVLLEDVDRIEVIRGPGGTIWGPNAVNGVINIITKNTKDTHGGLVTVRGGNVDQGAFNARYGGGDGKKFDYRVYLMGFDRGPEFHSDRRDFDRWRMLQGGFRTDWAKNDRDTFTFQGDLYREGIGESVSATTYAPPYTQILTGTAPLSGGNLFGRWQRILSEGNDIQVQAYYDRTNRRELNFADYRDTFDVDLLDRFRLPARQQISWGFGLRFSLGRNPEIISGLTFLPTERTDQLLTFFFQDEIELVPDHLNLSLGTKFLHTNFTGLQLQPSVRLVWTPTRKQTLWAAFTQAVRTPSAAERNFHLAGFGGVGSDGVPIFARFDPNPDFRSERLTGYELGYRRLLSEKFYFDIALFYNRYGDLFSEGFTGPPFIETDPPPTHILVPAAFGNGLVATTKGVEIAPEMRLTSFWRLGASYSYLQMNVDKATNSTDIGTGPFIEGSSPKHQATVRSDFDLTKRFSLDLTYRYVSALPNLAIPSYSTADARFAWQLNHYFQLSVVGQNLLQPYHSEFGNETGPPLGIKRSVYGQITWKR